MINLPTELESPTKNVYIAEEIDSVWKKSNLELDISSNYYDEQIKIEIGRLEEPNNEDLI